MEPVTIRANTIKNVTDIPSVRGIVAEQIVLDAVDTVVVAIRGFVIVGTGGNRLKINIIPHLRLTGGHIRTFFARHGAGLVDHDDEVGRDLLGIGMNLTGGPGFQVEVIRTLLRTRSELLGEIQLLARVLRRVRVRDPVRVRCHRGSREGREQSEDHDETQHEA